MWTVIKLHSLNDRKLSNTDNWLHVSYKDLEGYMPMYLTYRESVDNYPNDLILFMPLEKMKQNKDRG